jgi:hypothetical protein
MYLSYIYIYKEKKKIEKKKERRGEDRRKDCMERLDKKLGVVAWYKWYRSH